MEAFIDRLIEQMTLGEKIGQLCQLGASIYGDVDGSHYAQIIERGQAGSFIVSGDAKKLNAFQRIAVTKSRLKIPLLFASDVIHGIRTVFPTPLAESCSWNPEIARKTAEAAAFEATALGLKWTYAPMVDITRDCRWGRVIEGAGEDPYLGRLFAAARVKGFQGGGDKIDAYHMAACAKHFAFYGAAESGKEYNSVQLSQSNMLNIYLPPFKACVDAGVLSFMTAFNDINGTPCTVSYWLNQEVLRNTWGFGGILITDYDALREVIAHGYCAEGKECAAEGVKSGVTVDMQGNIYSEHISGLVADGILKEEQIDALVRQVLRVKYKLGLFDNPYADEGRAGDIMTAQTLETARISAEQSVVLLKNDGVLPLKDKTKILLVGDLADDRAEMHGAWATREDLSATVSIREGLSQYFDVTYIGGCGLDSTQEGVIDKAAAAAKDADVIIATVGESLYESGEAHSKSDISLRGNHRALINALACAKKPLIALLVNGRPLAVENEVNKVNALVECWQLGTMAGRAVANILSGRFNPQGKLTLSFPRATGQCPVYYNRFSTGRPYSPEYPYTSRYIDCAEGALFPFGYGLSYSDIKLKSPRLSRVRAQAGQNVTVTVTAENHSAVAGTETVQLYMQCVTARPVRPVKELLRFEKITLYGGQSAQVSLCFNTDDLGACSDAALVRRAKKGKYVLYIGCDSENCEALDFEIV